MPDDLELFTQQAMNLGLGARLARFRDEVEFGISSYPPHGDCRYLLRLHSQRERLLNPDLKLIASVLSNMLIDDRERLEPLQPVLRRLLDHHPYLHPLVLDLPQAA